MLHVLHLSRWTIAVVCVCLLAGAAGAGQSPAPRRIYWGDEVPKAWNGTWPAPVQTVPERTRFSRTTSTLELHEFINTLKRRSDRLHVFPVCTSATGKIAPAVVLANPRVSSPAEARASGKAVIYLQGNIHPPEPGGTEALLMVMRDILFGSRQHLLDHQILVILPVFDMDGTDMVSTQDGTPHIAGSRVNARGLDLNRDAVKLETPEVNGLYQNVLNRWDPLLFVDLHLMGRVKHGYANTCATSTVPAAHPGPRTYVWDTLCPAVREAVRRGPGSGREHHRDRAEDGDARRPWPDGTIPVWMVVSIRRAVVAVWTRCTCSVPARTTDGGRWLAKLLTARDPILTSVCIFRRELWALRT